MTAHGKSHIALRYWLLGRDWHFAADALEYAATYHTGTRKDGVTPEYAHQIAIAQYLRTFHQMLLYPEETLAAALLHDVREDYDVADEEIRGRFGELVADAVDAMTKTFRGNKHDTAVVFQKIAHNPIASVVKGADRIHNQHTCHGVFTPTKVRAYTQETYDWIMPMLHNARTMWTQQEPIYENLKFVLTSQMQLLRAAAKIDPEPTCSNH
jgi:(p)ppGpp synthase/HD superfamily hydrolase